MLSIRSSHKRLIILVIILVSVYTGFKLSKFETGKPKEVQVDVKEAENIFKSSTNYLKTSMSFRVSDINDAETKLRKLIQLEGVYTKYYYNRNNSIVTVIVIPQELQEQADRELRNIPGLQDEKSTSSPKKIAEKSIDISSHIQQNKLILSRLQERVKSPHLTTREIGELKNELGSIQAIIDSLSSIKSIEEEREKSLVFAVVTRAMLPITGGKFTQYTNLILAIIGSLIGFTIITILAFYCFTLLGKLFNAIGIKTARSSSRYGGYKYGSYGGYGYADKRIRKKKKVYVRKEDKENKDNQNTEDGSK